MFKRLIIFSALALATLGTMSAQGFGKAQKINNDWYFTLSDPKYGGAEFYDHSSWRRLSLPHDWSVEASASPANASCTGFLPGGTAWYRKELDIPAELAGKKVFVYFEGVYNNSEVFVNGKWLGVRPNGYISFMYELTPYLNFGGRNVLAVRVDHSESADSRWYTGSGIYRNVYLVTSEQVHLGQWGVSYQTAVEKNKATVNVAATLANQSSDKADVKVVGELFDAKGRKVASSSTRVAVGAMAQGQASMSMNLASPVLWDLDNPYLYKLVTTVYLDGKQCDSSSVDVGIRYLTFDPDKGFALNGRSMKLKGVCIHHDAGSFGAAVPEEVWLRRIRQLKAIGCNAIRTSHNPQSECFYDICDREGMLVYDEAFDEWEYAKKKWVEGWNQGTPVFQGSANYFRQWGKQDLGDMVRRDRNHPSIIMWSIGNEVDYPNDPYSHPVLDKEGIGQQHESGYKLEQPRAERLGEIARELVEVVKRYDTSRPATAALAGAVMSNQTDYPFVLDVVGYNYTENRYAQDHAQYPQRVLYGSENRHDIEAWHAVTDNDYIMGQFIWTGIDYLGESHPWPSRGFTTGLIDLAGYIKPSGYFRRALWAEEPVAYVGTYRQTANRRLRTDAPHYWNYEVGETITVALYTNCEQAELLIDGRQVGELKDCDTRNGITVWDIPYCAGELKAICYNNGVAVAEDSVSTSGTPYAIEAQAIAPSMDTDGERLWHLLITITDSEGRPVAMADNEVTLTLSGNATLKGLESGSNDAADNYRDNHQRCMNGRLAGYISTQGDAGEVTVTLTSPYLKMKVMRF